MSKMASATQIFKDVNGDKVSFMEKLITELKFPKNTAQTYFYTIKGKVASTKTEEVKGPRAKRVSTGESVTDLQNLYNSLSAQEKKNWSRDIDEAALWARENLDL